ACITGMVTEMKKFAFAVMALIVATPACSASHSSSVADAIVGGKAVSENDPRFKAVRQLLGTGGNCTGTFITPNTMLAAGQCLNNATDGDFLGVQPGNLPVPTSTKNLGVVGKAQAERVFGTANGYKDLALLNFGSAVAPATLPLCKERVALPHRVYLVGYGFN